MNELNGMFHNSCVANVKFLTGRITTRFSVLWAAIKYLFTGRGMWLSQRISVNVSPAVLYMEAWVKRSEAEPYEHWAVSFDGKVANGSVNGVMK